MQVLLLVLFIAYFYVPYLLFKFFVEESIDLVRRKDLTRVEEFFGAAFPSALLNLFTYTLLRLLRATFGFAFPPPIDWEVASSLLDPQLVAIRQHVATGLTAEIGYLAALYFSSCMAGKMYGRIELKLLERRAAPVSFLLRGRVQNRVRWAVALIFRRIWLPFFAEALHPLQPWLVQQVWVFVRTKDDRLYFGQLFEYVNNGAGDVDTVTLTHVQRYARKTVAECLASGRCPLTRLSGSFTMKWGEISDINIASPQVMLAVRRKYARKLRTIRAAKRASANAPVLTPARHSSASESTLMQTMAKMLAQLQGRK